LRTTPQAQSSTAGQNSFDPKTPRSPAEEKAAIATFRSQIDDRDAKKFLSDLLSSGTIRDPVTGKLRPIETMSDVNRALVNNDIPPIGRVLANTNPRSANQLRTMGQMEGATGARVEAYVRNLAEGQLDDVEGAVRAYANVARDPRASRAQKEAIEDTLRGQTSKEYDSALRGQFWTAREGNPKKRQALISEAEEKLEQAWKNLQIPQDVRDTAEKAVDRLLAYDGFSDDASILARGFIPAYVRAHYRKLALGDMAYSEAADTSVGRTLSARLKQRSREFSEVLSKGKVTASTGKPKGRRTRASSSPVFPGYKEAVQKGGGLIEFREMEEVAEDFEGADAVLETEETTEAQRAEAADLAKLLRQHQHQHQKQQERPHLHLHQHQQ
jgi:hypothetical protein